MDAAEAQQNEVFERAAELFGLLSTPIRLRIISELCNCEKNVGQLLNTIEVAQPNMSQHLNMLYRAGVVAKRRQGAQVFYRIADESVALVCRAVCTQVAGEMDGRI
ncbi:MAG: winged helix-turn-helix transcriptional regulator [Comamonadaceae bacterium]|uniref:ArsR/SmtB family transcription factor n=1 Tax=Candidatus Skiveiella danica TaxID=3386177 RepID=UPI001B612038|nr:winged helix-turn-helix transcriptional regulator [Comamonadaceae bacterium]MBK9196953.1 winged helix-turn-helix transcriptional regulator [Betaproteobacteria bacterium]MBP8101031.1 winged helix-turn-helix transcriptional regulator [Burkholderiaceae bacterium]MBK6557631.1 winged helix-turn-helix transcriptional regulator [Comamonadaceae bacterium]MBK6928187.1 winged helix-turn-helix transcriptional regulator [Comamonadaceae bacterium]